jgi:hypothetical protein
VIPREVEAVLFTGIELGCASSGLESGAKELGMPGGRDQERNVNGKLDDRCTGSAPKCTISAYARP